MNTSLVNILKTVDSIKSAWEPGNSEMVAADSAKLAAQLAAGIAVESVVRTYSTLDGLGKTLALRRLDMAIGGKSIAGHQALSGLIAGEAVGNLIDAIRNMNLGTQTYDLLHPTSPDPTTPLPFTGGGDSNGGTGSGSGSGTGSGSGSGSGGGADGSTGLVIPAPPNGPSDDSGGHGNEGAVPPRRDPLVLDLDGDGIETTSPRTGTVILFDHNADGIKTGTGWVRPDDAWLVLDRDGNGSIDSGRELFGVDTLKANGQLAADGFDALREFDTNGNGQVEATDSAFASLALWRDLNQDGISQAHELTSLTGHGIASIGIDANGSAQALTDGNLISAMGQFTRTNGIVGTTGEVNGAINNAVANLDLLQNTFYSQYTTAVPLTSQAQGLPSMRGSGRVRRLNEAISLSGSLGDLVGTYVQQTTRQAQVGMLDGFITQWAATSDMQTLKDQAAALAGSGVTLAYSIEGMHWVEAVNAANDHLFVKVA